MALIELDRKLFRFEEEKFNEELKQRDQNRAGRPEEQQMNHEPELACKRAMMELTTKGMAKSFEIIMGKISEKR